MQNFVIFISALLLSTVGHIATDIYLPSFPAMVEYFNTSAGNVQLTLSAYMLSFSLVPLFAGPISDRVGRKQPILFGISIGICGTIFCALASNIYILIVSRFLQGIGLGIVVTVSRTILPDNFHGKELAKYFSYNIIAMPLMLAIAPPLGGIIQEYSSWRMIFVFIFIYLIGLMVSIKLLMPGEIFREPVAKINYENYLNSFFRLLQNKQFVLYTLYGVLVFIGLACYLTLAPFIFQETLGLSPSQFGSLSLLFCVVTTLAGLINARLINHYSTKQLLWGTAFLIFLSGLLLIAFNYYEVMNINFFLIFIMLFFYAMPTSLANAGATALETVKGNFGTAMALLSCLQFLGGGLSSILVSLIGRASITVLGGAFTLIAVGCLTINVVSSKQPVKEPLL